MSRDHGPPEVTVAVLTYRRPACLPELLTELAAQCRQVGGCEVVVVDNDPEGSAGGMVGALGLPEVRYVFHGEGGIASGRNRALEESEHSRALVFIDDDEYPRPGWLAALLETMSRYGAAAVTGPVLRTYDSRPDPDVLAARVFDRPAHSTGTRMPAAGTGNLALDMAVVRDLGIRFDDDFSQTGGSDTMFTRSLDRAGAAIVWCAEAIVVESVPADRLTRTWVWRRSLRSGLTWTRTSVALVPRPVERVVTRARGVVAGIARVVVGSARIVWGAVLRDPDHQGRGLRTQARGVGMIGGSLGAVYHEYDRSVRTRGSGPT